MVELATGMPLIVLADDLAWLLLGEEHRSALNADREPESGVLGSKTMHSFDEPNIETLGVLCLAGR